VANHRTQPDFLPGKFPSSFIAIFHDIFSLDKIKFDANDRSRSQIDCFAKPNPTAFQLTVGVLSLSRVILPPVSA